MFFDILNPLNYESRHDASDQILGTYPAHESRPEKRLDMCGVVPYYAGSARFCLVASCDACIHDALTASTADIATDCAHGQQCIVKDHAVLLSIAYGSPLVFLRFVKG